MPNYLKTFNYKASFDILPCKTNFVEFGLDIDSRCNFCKLHADTAPHMFSNCPTIKHIWVKMDEIMRWLHFKFTFIESRKNSNFNLTGGDIVKEEEKLVIYLNTVVNYKIWKFNLKIQYDKIEYNQKQFFSSLCRTIDGRRKMQLSDRMKHSKKIQGIDRLYDAVKGIHARLVG